ncbi:hypothetical protein FIBSPDRAFT_859771 [Athelia psychrophila]|uniref:Uncharacterized protein n=1 Tax=Athelia psychrophila TaxID=1759441 RepID=A0A166KRR1_9AGAM|nr:hypothetical protein FIBSPDRAFT_859771 [Fibularhizoctonia sp. CBS 109695]
MHTYHRCSAHAPAIAPRTHARAVSAAFDNHPSTYAAIRPVEATVVDAPHCYMATSHTPSTMIFVHPANHRVNSALELLLSAP